MSARDWYFVAFFGDLATTYHGRPARENAAFPTFDAALAYAQAQAPEPDPEDDRILIVRIVPNDLGLVDTEVVWHFSGWHFDLTTDDLGEQGCWPGDSVSVYAKAMDW